MTIVDWRGAAVHTIHGLSSEDDFSIVESPKARRNTHDVWHMSKLSPAAEGGENRRTGARQILYCRTCSSNSLPLPHLMRSCRFGREAGGRDGGEQWKSVVVVVEAEGGSGKDEVRVGSGRVAGVVWENGLVWVECGSGWSGSGGRRRESEGGKEVKGENVLLRLQSLHL